MSSKTTTRGTVDRYDVYIVEEYQDKSGEDKASWTRIGAAWAHKDGKGFSAELRALPVNGKLVMRLFEAQ